MSLRNGKAPKEKIIKRASEAVARERFLRRSLAGILGIKNEAR